jgi:hypothetical protein
MPQSLGTEHDTAVAPAVTARDSSDKLATEADGDVTMAGAAADDDDYVHVSMAEGRD